MADDKKAGGGVGWEAFEVIIVILLAVGLLSRLQGKPVGELSPNQQSDQTITQTDPQSSTCGLSIVRPHSLEKVTSIVTVTGSTGGCNWSATQTVALYAQVVDSYGVPVSAYTIVPPSSFVDEQSASFSTTITLTGTPAPGTGYLILIPAKNSGTNQITARIPLKF